MDTPRQLQERDLNNAMLVLIDSAIEELRAQGYVDTGQGISSFETKIEVTGLRVLEGQIWGEEYLMFLDTGTEPHRPPFDGIFPWVRRKFGLSEEESVNATWAVITNIGKYGTPTPNSYELSTNGRRLEWSKFAALAAEEDIDRIFEDGEWVELALDNVIRENLE